MTLRFEFDEINKAVCISNVLSIIQSIEGLNRTKMQRRENSFPSYLLLELGLGSLLALW
jgi:hypothetical protein